MIICSSIIRNRQKTIHHRFLLSCTLACHCSCLLYCPMLLLLHTTVAATATVWYSCLLLSLCRRALCIKLSLPQILFQRRHMCFKLKIQTKIHTFYPDPQIESMMSLYIKEGTCPHTCRPFLDFCNKKYSMLQSFCLTSLNIASILWNFLIVGDMLKWHRWTNEE